MIVTRFLRAHGAFAQFFVVLALSIVTCGALGRAFTERNQRIKNDRAHEQELHLADGVIDSLDAQLDRVQAKATRDGTAVTTTRTAYRTVHDTLLLEMERAHSDVARLLPHLPVFIQRADDAVNWCAEYQKSATAERRVADSLIATLRAGRDSMLAWAPWKPPRYEGHVDGLYDPIAKVPAVAVDVAVRVAGSWSAIARGEYRIEPGTAPLLYVGGRKTF